MINIKSETGKSLPLLPMTAEGFAPFGSCFSFDAFQSGCSAEAFNSRSALKAEIESAAAESSSLINQGSSRRISLLPAMDLRAAKADAVLQAYLARQRNYPLVCFELERHVQADQVFVAMQEQQSLVIVSCQERPTHEGLRAFITEKGQSFSIRKAVWHHGLICLAAHALYLVIEGGDYANDCSFCSLDERYTIDDQDQ